MNLRELIAKDLCIPESELISIMNSHHRLFRYFKIKKKSDPNQFRTLCSPSREARMLQMWIQTRILDQLKISKNSFAYVKGKSTSQNAHHHLRSKYFLKRDFSNFFPSIRFEDIQKVLEEHTEQLIIYKNHKGEINQLIRNFCFNSNGEMSQGFITSPAISNIVMKKFDEELMRKLKLLNSSTKYTRYADDIVISFSKMTLKREIEKIFADQVREWPSPKLRMNHAKSKFGIKASGSVHINGLKITHDNRVTLHRNYKDNLRSIIHRTSLTFDPAQCFRLIGHINYVRSVDIGFYTKIYVNHGNVIEKAKEIIGLQTNNNIR